MKKIITPFLFVFLIFSKNISAQEAKIKSQEGFSPQIGTMVSMLEDLKKRVEYQVKNLNQEQTDFLLDEKANRIGAMILHLAATEVYYQNATFNNGAFNEDKKWTLALQLGKKARKKLKDKPIQYYMDIWNEVRAETLRFLKTKDDAWFNANMEGNPNINNYWAWFHVMEHQANHMGQIALIKKRMPKK
ncbi:DinB family protein [Aureivirga sp. CE67]|uniref:DinB family protein n=1 Tax=Aureivirga sp. CE67 TaxID=1788983 RepID=UPI0018CA606F|nr:DUF664 domain-containing protein [Aureivirga sp. CE67]